MNVHDNATAQVDSATDGILRLLETGLAAAVLGSLEHTGTSSFTLNTLYARGDTVIIGQGDAASSSPVGNVLNVGTLDGYANFVVNTNLTNDESDQIKIAHVENSTEANTIRINYDPALAKGESVTDTHTLVAAVDETNAATFKGSKSTIGGVDYLPTVTSEDAGKTWYIRKVVPLEANEQAHNILIGSEAAMAALSAGNEFIGAALEGLADESNTGTDGLAVYAKLGGGTLHQETGSHVNVHTSNAILALGHVNRKERGTMEYGTFFEYGRGSYTTVNGDLRGKGDSHYTGGRLLAKWTVSRGFYVEGSLRGGQSRDNGKYFYNRKGGVSFTAGPNAYKLDSVTSHIIRLGARYMMKREKWNYYGGLAYEQELGGQAKGTVDGFAIRKADTSGGSLYMELGAILRPTEQVSIGRFLVPLEKHVASLQNIYL